MRSAHPLAAKLKAGVRRCASNPVHGGSGQSIGPFNLAGVGSFRLATSETGSDRLGDFRKIREP